MKKTSILLLCAILLSSCSLTVEQFFLIPTQTFTPSATSTITPTDIPTLTATVATPTFTFTPTLVGQKTATSTPEFTPTSTVTPIPDTPTATVEIKGFVTVFTSVSEFFQAGICEPASVKFTAQAANPIGTAFVVLFVRFKSRQTGATSEWTSITMQNMGAGTFNHDLVANEMKGVDSFRNSRVQYQFVATDSNTREIGRTAIFSERLSVADCVPTPTPLISPTASTPTP